MTKLTNIEKKTFEIVSLKLTNFKGVKSLTIEPKNYHTKIYGDNETGKTTVADSFIWLLFDKDSRWRSTFDIKTLDEDNKAIPMLDHSVEGSFIIAGQKLNLAKTYKEKWTKKRGRAKKEFSGHTTDYQIDGVPVSRSAYNARIAELIDEDVFKLLTSPSFFSEQLTWEARRKLLLTVCGDISDSEVIKGDKDLTKLLSALNGRSIDNHKKVVAAARKKINQELAGIPARIDELSKEAPERLDADRVQREIDELETKLAAINKKINEIENGERASQLRVEIAELDARIKNMETDYRQDRIKEAEKLEAEARALLGQAIRDEINSLGRRIVDAKERVTELTSSRENLIENYKMEAAKTFEVSKECKACGQNLPESKIKSIQENFNTEKANFLKTLNAHGKKVRAKLDEAKAEFDALDKKYSEKQIELKKIEDQEKKLFDQAEAIRSVNVVPHKEYLDLVELRSKTVNELEALDLDNVEKASPSVVELKEIEEKISALRDVKAEINAYKKNQERIQELKARERELAGEFESWEQQLFACEEFTRRKVEMLEEKINSKFELVKFKLFDEQINGGLSEFCEAMIRGIPYPSLNNAGQIQAGLDIIKTLSTHHGFYPPVFIDNAESITRLPQLESQMIELVVCKGVKELSLTKPLPTKEELLQLIKEIEKGNDK